VQLNNQLRLRAHFQIQTHMPPEPYDRKSFGSSPYCPAILYSEQSTEKIAPNPYLRVSIAAARPKNVRLRTFSHVSADSTSPRLSPGKVRGSRGRGKDRSPFLSHERGAWQEGLCPSHRRSRA
jgi:hypothetical protein